MTPKEITTKIEAFQNIIRRDIASSIACLLNVNDGRVNVKEDSYHGYPRVYDKNDHCVVDEIRGAHFQDSDKEVILLITGPGRKRVRLDRLEIGEQLQVLEILLHRN